MGCFIAMQIDRISVTSMESYERCPYCWLLGQRGAKPADDVQGKFDVGSQVHKAIEKYYEGDYSYMPDSAEAQMLYGCFCHQVPLTEESSLAEVKFEIPLVRPDLDRDLGVTMTGRVDRVFDNRIEEYKTAASAWSEVDVMQSFQATAYAWWFYNEYGFIPKIVYNFLLKLKTPRLERMETYREVDHFIAWFDRVEDILNGIRNDWYPVGDTYMHVFADCPGKEN